MKRLRMGVMVAALVIGGASLGSVAYAEKALSIADGTKVTMEYTLTLPDKTVADSTAGQPPFSYIHGGQQIIPGLEKALTGLKPGDKKSITVPAAEAYGLYDKKKIVEVPKKNVPAEATVGTRLRDRNGQEAKVVEIKGDSVMVDVNHPLAGQDLTFDVNIIKVEKAPPAPAEK